MFEHREHPNVRWALAKWRGSDIQLSRRDKSTPIRRFVKFDTEDFSGGDRNDVELYANSIAVSTAG